MTVEDIVVDRYNFRKKFTEYVNTLYKLSNKEMQEEFARIRQIPINSIKENDIFWVGNSAELMIPEYIGLLEKFGLVSEANNKPIFNNRWVIPIKDKDNLVQALVGYSNASDNKYVYSTTDYYLRGDSLYGEEQLEQTMKDGYAVLVEGITDAIHVRSLGFNNIYANCGSRKGTVNFLRLNRLKHGLIRICDRDRAGDGTKKRWITDRYIDLVTPPQFKDSDEVLKNVEYKEIFREYLEECIRIIKDNEFKGKEEINFI
jgi:DNA primase